MATFNGDGTNETFGGTTDVDVAFGAGGDDTLSGGDGNDSLSGGDGNDSLGGGAGADTVSGDAGNDTVVGGGGDLIDGGSGSDTLIVVGAGGGGVSLNGGVDNDVFVAINLLSGVPAGTFAGSTFNGGAGHDTLVIGGAVNFQGALNSIEGISLLAADANANRGAAVLDIGSSFDLNPDFEGGPATLLLSGTGLIRYTSTVTGDDVDLSNAVFADGSSVALEVHGAGGADFLIGSSNGDSIVGEAGNDSVGGGGGGDTLAGAAGNDFLSGGDGSDNIVGGLNDDTLSGDAGNDTLGGDLGNDLLQGGDGADNLNTLGGQGLDTLNGGAGDDVLSALNFTITGPGIVNPVVFNGDFAGSQFNGGTGYDTLVVMGDTTFRGGLSGIEEVFLKPAGDIASGPNTIHFAPTTLRIGSGFGPDSEISDTVTFSGTGKVIFTISDGDDEFAGDHVIYRDGSSVTFEVHGSAGADTITGTSLGDSLVGEAGADTIGGAGGDDTVNGALGNDSVSGGEGADNLAGGADSDTLSGDAGNDILDGGIGMDLLQGGDGADTLRTFGGQGLDTLNGDAGDDVLVAMNFTLTGPGIVNPVVFNGDFAGSQFNGGAGYDTLVVMGDTTFRGAVTGVEEIFLQPASDVASGPNTIHFAPAVLRIGSGFGPDPEASDTVTFSGTGKVVYTIAPDDDEFTGDKVIYRDGSNVTFEVHGSAGADTITGTSLGDSLVGEAGADTIGGGGGDDTVNGALGNDIISGGEGADNLAGGADNDTLSGDAGNDTLGGDIGDDLLQGGDGVDNLSTRGGQGADTLNGDAGDDVLSALNFSVTGPGIPGPVAFSGDFAGSRFNGGAGYDTLVVTGDSNFRGTLNGIEEVFLQQAGDVAAGPNTVHFTETVLRIGTGFDANPDAAAKVTVSGTGKVIYTIVDTGDEFDGSDVTFRAGSNVAFTVLGGLGADTITGTSQADVLQAGAGADRVIAGAGDAVTLGAGADTLVVDAAMTIGGAAVSVTDFAAGSGGDALSLNAFLAARTNWVAGTNPFTSGHIRVVESAAGAALQVDANGGGDSFTTIVELAGVSPLALTAANLGGWAPEIKGGATSDAIAFIPEAPVQAGDAAPALDGGAGVDTLTLDTTKLNPASVVGPATITPSADGTALLFDLNGDGVTDLVVTNVEDVVLNGQRVVISGDLAGTGLAPNTIHYGGTEKDDLFDAGGLTSLESVRAKGELGNDTMTGANDDDTLEGGDGNDLLTGRGGPDSLNGGAGTDTLRGGDGGDTLDGGTDADKLFGDAGVDSLVGGAGTDELHGGDDADTVDGGADADLLFGDAGDDFLFGGLGADKLDGGNGKDDLSGGDGNDTLFGGNGQDTLAGGAGADYFQIDNGAADRVLDFHQGEDKLVFLGGKGSVSWKIVDADGDGLKDDLQVSAGGGYSVELIGVTTLTSNDWIFQ